MTQFNQPTALPTDAETQNHINALNAQIADKEATIVRHNGVITSLQYTIQQLSNEKAELETKIPLLKDEAEKLGSEIAELESKLDDQTKVLEQIKEESIYRKEELDKKEKEIEKAEKELAKEKEVVSNDRMKVITDRVEIETKKEEVEKKIAALKQIIN